MEKDASHFATSTLVAMALMLGGAALGAAVQFNLTDSIGLLGLVVFPVALVAAGSAWLGAALLSFAGRLLTGKGRRDTDATATRAADQGTIALLMVSAARHRDLRLIIALLAHESLFKGLVVYGVLGVFYGFALRIAAKKGYLDPDDFIA